MPTENRTTLTPDTPVRYLKGVGPKTAERFEKLGIVTLADLLCHYPRRYIDFSKPYSIAEAPADTECVVKAEVFAKPGGRILPGGRRMERITAGDDVASLEITWFNNPYATQKLQLGQEYYFQGIVTGGMLRRQMVNPQVRTAEQIQPRPLRPFTPRPRDCPAAPSPAASGSFCPTRSCCPTRCRRRCCKNTVCCPRPRRYAPSTALPPRNRPQQRGGGSFTRNCWCCNWASGGCAAGALRPPGHPCAAPIHPLSGRVCPLPPPGRSAVQ